MYKKRLGGTIKPASAIHLGSVAFLPLWGIPYIPPQGVARPVAKKVHATNAFYLARSARAPSALAVMGVPGLGRPGSRSLGQRSCLWGRPVFHLSSTGFQHYLPAAAVVPGAFWALGEPALKHLAWPLSQNGFQFGDLVSAPPCFLLLTSTPQPRPRQGPGRVG